MAKVVSKIATREQRKKLKAAGKPYYEAFERGLDFGYRKNQHGGSWVLRRYIGQKRYAVETIGAADDDPAEAKALAFHEARDKARSLAQERADEARIASLGPVVTVRQVVEEYLAAREKREGDAKGVKRDARSRLGRHVLAGALGPRPLASLTKQDLAKWREGLAASLADGSIRRTSNDLKAALNVACRRHEAQLPARMRDIIKDGLASKAAVAPQAREAQVLPDADVRRLITAAREVDAAGGWDGDLVRIVLVLAATGARFSQIVRMAVADVQAAQSRLMVPTSRKGRGTKHTEVDRRSRRRRRARCARAGDGRAQGFGAALSAPALAANRAGEMGTGRTGAMVRRRRIDAPLGRDRRQGRPRAGNSLCAASLFDCARNSAPDCRCAWLRRCTTRRAR